MSDESPLIIGDSEALRYIVGQNRDTLAAIASLRSELVALTQAEQAGLDSLKAKIDAFGSGALETQRVLTAERDRLLALLDSVRADDAADKALIDELTASVRNLDAAAKAHETDVIGAFADASDDFDKFSGTP